MALFPFSRVAVSRVALSLVAVLAVAPAPVVAAEEPAEAADLLAREIARGHDLLERRLTADAVTAFRRADELAGGGSVEALVGLARAYHLLGASSTAEKAVRRALEAAGEDPDLRRRSEEALRLVRREAGVGRDAAADGDGQDGPGGLSMTTLDGRTLTLERLAGRAVLLDFWGTWCSPCREATPALGRLVGKLEGEPFELVGVSSDPKGKLEVYLAQNDVDWTQVWDPDREITRGRFQVANFPTYVLLDHEGREVYRVSGWSPGIRRRLERKVEAAVRAARESAARSGGWRPVR